MFIKSLQDQHVKEGKDPMARFECVFSKSGIKAKWFKGRQELFTGKKFNMVSTGDLHVLEIREPRVDDMGQYKCVCLEKFTTASLEVDYPDPVFKFTRPLQKKYEQYTGRELVLECTTNHSKAQVKWYKGDSQVDTNDSRLLIEKDTFGKHFLKIKHCREEDTDDYSCRIVNTEEITKTKVVCTEKIYVFVKPLLSQKCLENETIVLECEVDERDAEVKWFKDGKEVAPIPKKIDIVAEGRKRKMIIKKGKVTDEAKYSCKTNGDTTECEILVERMFVCHTSQCCLIIPSHPLASNKFRKKLTDKTVIEREEILLEIEMLEKRAPLKWYHNGEEVRPSDRYIYAICYLVCTLTNLTIFLFCRIQLKFDENTGKQQLIISDAHMDDMGTYMAKAKDCKTSCTVTVKEGEKKPELKPEKTDYQGDVGRPFTLEIPYKGITQFS